MKTNLLLFISFLVVFFSSCSATHFYTGFTPNDAMDGMMLLGPYSVQYYIDKKRNDSYNDTLSLASEDLIASLVEKIGLPITSRVQLNSDQEIETMKFMNFIKDQKRKSRGDYPIPLMFDELLEEAGQRYGLLIYANGISRDTTGLAKENETKEAMNFLLGILSVASISMGYMPFYGGPLYSDFVSSISVAILVSEKDQIVFYELSSEEESHPLDPKSVRMQLMEIFKDFYY